MFSGRSPIILLLFIVIFYFGCFWLLFEVSLEQTESAFLFEAVVALMSTGLLAIVTGFMFNFQSQIENKKENRARIFETKIVFYTDVLSELDQIFLNQKDENTSHKFVFLISKAMLIASPSAAQSFMDLFTSFENDSSPETEGQVARNLSLFLKYAREDLDQIDDLSKLGMQRFEPILKRLEKEIDQESKKLRSWTSEQKSKIIQDYDLQEKNKVKWLKEKHNLYPSQIATWRRQIP